MVVDRRLVERLLREIESNVEMLAAVQTEPQSALFSDPLRAYGVQYALQVAIEALISASHHLIIEAGLPTPERSVDAVSILSTHGVIRNAELAARLPRMVRFRNLLVHRYWEVDPDIVYAILQNDLGDLRDFCAEVSRYLDHQPPGNDNPQV